MTRSHALTLAVGFVLGLVVLVSMGQTAVDRSPIVRVQYMPHPRDMVQIKQGTPYTVPAGRILVITGLGTGAHFTSGKDEVTLKINGVSEAMTASEVSCFNGDGVGSSMVTVPPGCSATAGSTVEVVEGGGQTSGRAWGYLADA